MENDLYTVDIEMQMQMEEEVQCSGRLYGYGYGLSHLMVLYICIAAHVSQGPARLLDLLCNERGL